MFQHNFYVTVLCPHNTILKVMVSAYHVLFDDIS